METIRSEETKKAHSGKDMLVLPSGEVYHLGAAPGDIHPRIITVGAHARADQIGELLDKTPHPPTTKTSSRLFRIVSGTYKGVPVSIVAIGMGAPMADFLMREFSYLHPRPMAIIRLGTCGLFHQQDHPGTVVVADPGSCYVYKNYAYFDGCANDASQDGPTSNAKPYLITKPVKSDNDLSDRLYKCLKASGVPVARGLNAAAETFWACQGREDDRFDDADNQTLVKELGELGVRSVEMETHQVLHLAQHRTCAPCYAAGCAIGVVNRTNPKMDENISESAMELAQHNAGIACLEALINTSLEEKLNGA